MNLKSVGFMLLLGAAAVGCDQNPDGTVNTPTVTAALRYVNLVSDTGAVDIRIVDVIGDAPNTVNAPFRTGGAPYGVTVTGIPQHTPVLAGTRRIRVFLNSSSIGVTSTVMHDTSFTFEANKRYSLYLVGFARTGQSPAMRFRLVQDTIVTVPAGKFALRVMNFAPSLAGNPAGTTPTSIDAFVGLATSAVPIPTSAGLPQAATGLAYGQIGSYVMMDTSSIPSSGTIPLYRLAATANGTTSPVLFQTTFPSGTRGTSSSNPVPGSGVVGSVITALIVPRSVPGSSAPSTTPTPVDTGIVSVTRSNDTVLVTRSISPATATACQTATAPGFALQNVIHVTGLTQPEYNGSHAVVSTTTGTSQVRWRQATVTLSGVVTAGANFRLSAGSGFTTDIAWDAPAAAVEEALQRTNLPGFGNVRVTGAAGGPYTVTFVGSYTGAAQPSLTASSTGGGTVTVATAAIACGRAFTTQFTVTAPGGNTLFRLSVQGPSSVETTVNIAGPGAVTPADSFAVRDALRALATASPALSGLASVTVGGAPGGPYTVRFPGSSNPLGLTSPTTGMTITRSTAATTVFNTLGPTNSVVRYRVAGAPATPATGTPSIRLNTPLGEYESPSVVFLFDQLPARTAP